MVELSRHREAFRSATTSMNENEKRLTNWANQEPEMKTSHLVIHKMPKQIDSESGFLSMQALQRWSQSLNRARCPSPGASSSSRMKRVRKVNKLTDLCLQRCTHARPTVCLYNHVATINAFIIGWITQTHTHKQTDRRDYTDIEIASHFNFLIELNCWIYVQNVTRSEKLLFFPPLGFEIYESRSVLLSLLHLCTEILTPTDRSTQKQFFFS